MTRRLEPCPFCDADDATLVHQQRKVRCTQCGADGPVGETAAQGERLWNVRATPRSRTVERRRFEPRTLRSLLD